MSAAPAFRSFRGLGTTVVVGVAGPGGLVPVVEAVRAEVDACDRSCSRFREDSELSRLNARGRLEGASPWLCEAVETALHVARATNGLVDPSIGRCLLDLGYDRTFERVEPDSPRVVMARHVPAWPRVRVDRRRREVSVPAGVRLDLGATAKALCADRAAARAAAATGRGVLVSLGGDVAVAGPAPAGGWIVRVTDRSDTHPAAPLPGQNVAIATGGLATSGTAVRRWSRAGEAVHHLVDPRTGRPAGEVWRTASVAAASCVSANAASTAAIVLGFEATRWLEERGFDARLVSVGGRVSRAGRWPSEPAPAPGAVPA